MGTLTAKQRHGLAPNSFALPGGRYPINDPSHARNALARAAQHASPAEAATIRHKVHAKYPSIGVKKLADGGPVDAGYARGGNVHGRPIRRVVAASKRPVQAVGPAIAAAPTGPVPAAGAAPQAAFKRGGRIR